MSYHAEPDSCIKHKVKEVFNLISYATKTELEDVTGIDTSDLAAKKILLLWKLKLTNYTLINWLMFQLVGIM